jgi:hypothetical protein
VDVGGRWLGVGRGKADGGLDWGSHYCYGKFFIKKLFILIFDGLGIDNETIISV